MRMQTTETATFLSLEKGTSVRETERIQKERTWVSCFKESNFKKLTKMSRGNVTEFCRGVYDVSTLSQLPAMAPE